MDIEQFLYDNAIKDIWANPQVDQQVIYKLTRLTLGTGAVGIVDLSFSQFLLPDTYTRYHLFEMGAVPINNVGISTSLGAWVNVMDLLTGEDMIINVVSRGRQCDRATCYLKKLDNGNLLLAVEFYPNINILQSTDPTYIRFYSNDAITGNTALNVEYNTLIINQAQPGAISSFIGEITTLELANGIRPLLYMDGLLLVDGMVNFNQLPNGTIIEYVADPTINRLDTFVLNDLHTYNSTLDAYQKRIISTPKTQQYRYVDDLEIFVSGIRSSDGRRVGVLFLRIDNSYSRELTDCDWALHSGHLSKLVDNLTAFKDTGTSLTSLEVHVYQRMSKKYKPSVMDVNRIPDLTRLPMVTRQQALSGTKATLDIWNANNLENAPINLWRGLYAKDVTKSSMRGVYSRQEAISVLENVYLGYNAVNWALPPTAMSGGGDLLTYDLLGTNATFIPYDVLNHSGETYLNGTGAELYLPTKNATLHIDTLVAAGDVTDTIVDGGFGILVYYIAGGVPTKAKLGIDYTLSTIDSNITTIITWIGTITGTDRYVRTSQRMVKFTKPFLLSEISTGIDVYNGRPIAHDVGMGNLYVWWNTKYLIEELDYRVVSGKIYLIAKPNPLLVNNVLNVLYVGLPDDTLKHTPKGTWGWVKHGRLSNDTRFKLFTNHNNMLFIKGAAVPDNDVFLGSIVNNTDVHVDGSPFAFVPAPVFTRADLLDKVSTTEIDETNTSKRVYDYLNVMVPVITDNTPVVITTRYALVSTLINRLLEDIMSTKLTINETSYSYARLNQILSPYTTELAIDPARHNLDMSFVVIHPRWESYIIPVTTDEHNFLTLVIKNILDSKVTGLTLYLTIDNLVNRTIPWVPV